MIGIQWVVVEKIAKILDTILHDSLQCHEMPTRDVVRWCWVAESGRRRDRGRAVFADTGLGQGRRLYMLDMTHGPVSNGDL